jgi:hypothetical protein
VVQEAGVPVAGVGHEDPVVVAVRDQVAESVAAATVGTVGTVGAVEAAEAEADTAATVGTVEAAEVHRLLPFRPATVS